MARLPSITSKDQVAAKDRETWDSIVASRGAKGAAHATFEALCRVAFVAPLMMFVGRILSAILGQNSPDR